MTHIVFHFNAPDKLLYACRLARKMLRHDMRLVITGSSETLAALDQMLWNLAPQDFVAHCRADAAPEVLAASPVLLLEDLSQACHCEVLLNMGSAVPLGYENFDKLIEVVPANDQPDRHRARGRWRYYTEQGHSIASHDLVLQTA